MDGLWGLLASFGSNPGLRIAFGLVFFLLFGIWFFRRFGGEGKIVFLVVCLLLGLLFFFSPVIQLFAFLPLAVLLVLNSARPYVRQPTYLPAEALVEGGGVKRGLSAPEAAVVLERPLPQVLGVVILDLLKKGILTVHRQEPLALRVEPSFAAAGVADPQERSRRRRAAAQGLGVVLQPYEDPFLEQLSVDEGRPLGQVNLTAAARALLRHTARRVRGYSLAETQAYYGKHLGRARHDVTLAGDGRGALRTLDHYFEWLVLDADFADLYRAYQPDWLPAVNDGEASLDGEGSLVTWVDGLVRELGTSIPPGGLQVKDKTGNHLAIGGTDPVSGSFFAAIMREVG